MGNVAKTPRATAQPRDLPSGGNWSRSVTPKTQAEIRATSAIPPSTSTAIANPLLDSISRFIRIPIGDLGTPYFTLTARQE